jgi:hypothetical protein
MQTAGSNKGAAADGGGRSPVDPVARLLAAGDYRAVIELAERRAAAGSLDRDLRLAEARAFCALRLMDRAWVRLREATEADPDDVDALVLTAEVFVERGWPARARKLLARVEALRGGEPDEAFLQLVQRASEAPVQPPPDARELERSGAPPQLLLLAEQYLATGSFLRAKGLLERLRRSGHAPERVELLLWGMRGEFGGTAAEPAARSAGPLGLTAAPSAPQLDPSEWDAGDHTESVKRHELWAEPPTAEVDLVIDPDEPAFDPSFPALFRRGGAGRASALPADDEDVTHSSLMASADELLEPPEAEYTDPDGPVEHTSGDTQILQVIGGGALAPADGPIHKAPAGGPDPLRTTLDLRAYQESMGMAAEGDGYRPEPTGGDFLEEEDQDVVVMTRREQEPPAPPPEAPARRQPIEVIEKYPTPVVAPPAPADAVAAEPDGAQADEAELDAAPARRSGRAQSWLRLAVLMGGMGSLVAVVAVVLIGYLTRTVGEGVVEDAHRALAAGDFRGLGELEARLEAQVEGGTPPLGVREVELALVQAVVSDEYTGDPSLLDGAERRVESARSRGAPAAEVALAEGMIALARGDVGAADKALAGVDATRGAGLELATRAALAAGEGDRALDLLAGAQPTGLRHALLRPLALQAAGRRAEAAAAGAALLASSPDNALVALAAHEGRWVEMPPRERLAALDAMLAERRGGLAPRQEGRVHALRAQLFAELGQAADARNAWHMALAADGRHPTYLYVSAAEALVANRVLTGLGEMERCLAVRPLDAVCQRGAVQALLELDRVDQARAAVDAWEAAGADVVVLRAWVDLASGQPDVVKRSLAERAARLQDAGAVDPQEGLSWYLLGLALAGGRDQSAAPALERAARVLGASPDALDRLLAARADAASLPVIAAADVARTVKRAVERAPADPGVQVYIGRFYEQEDRRAAAAQSFDQAALLGPESAVAHYERGMFYYDPRASIALAREAWRRYLDLGPSGERANRVRQRLDGR